MGVALVALADLAGKRRTLAGGCANTCIGLKAVGKSAMAGTRSMKLHTRQEVSVEEEGPTCMADKDGDSDEARLLAGSC